MGQAGSTLCCGSQAAARRSITAPGLAGAPKRTGVLPDSAPGKGLDAAGGASPTGSSRSSSQLRCATPWGSATSAAHPLEAALSHLQDVVSKPCTTSAGSSSREQVAGKGRQGGGRPKPAVWDPAAASNAQARLDGAHTQALQQVAAALLAGRSTPGPDPQSGAPGQDPRSGAPGPDPQSGAPGQDPASGVPVSPGRSSSSGPTAGGSSAAHMLQHSCLLQFAIRELRSCSMTDVTQRSKYYCSLLEVLQQLTDAPETRHLLHLEFDGCSVARCIQGMVPSAQQFKKMALVQSGNGTVGALRKLPHGQLQDQDDSLRVVELLLRVASATACGGGEHELEGEPQDKLEGSPVVALGAAPSDTSLRKDGGSSTGGGVSRGGSSSASGSCATISNSNSTSTSSSSSSSSESAYIEVLQPLQVQYLPQFPSGHASAAAKEPAATPRARMVRVLREAAGLERLLPLTEASSVFVAVCEERATLWKALVVGPAGTPYEGGCFLFDIFLPWRYPACPPEVTFKTTGGGAVRFNPNLYKNGRVCLSLLGTWFGGKGETWDPAASSVLQVLVSIQALILVEQPWYNEPGRPRQKGTPYATTSSHNHNKFLREATVRWAMVEYLKAPPQEFADVIRAHFRLRGAAICRQIGCWVQEAAQEDSMHAQRLGTLLAQLQQQLRLLPSA